MKCRDSIRVSAPGSILLLGEHAVLHGSRALCCAVDQRMTVELAPRADRDVRICSPFGEARGTLDALPLCEELRFVRAAIAAWTHRLHHGFDLTLDDGLRSTVGLGSSAAATVCTGAALMTLLEGDLDRPHLLTTALDAIRAVQGRGSGSDAAASVFGGLLAYRPDPVWWQPLLAADQPAPNLALIFSGYKTPTPTVIHLVEQGREQHPELYARLDTLADAAVAEAADAVRQSDWSTLGRLMTLSHGLLEAMGVCDATLAHLVHALRALQGVRGAKISGSGLGDCVVALGDSSDWSEPFERIPVNVAREGVRLEQV